MYVRDLINTNTMKRSGKKLLMYGFIVAHDTGNPYSTAKNNVDYYKRTCNESYPSAHIFIDDKEARVCIPFDEKAWHVLYNKPLDNELFGDDANDIAIGFELCYFPNDKDRSLKAYQNYVRAIAETGVVFGISLPRSMIGHDRLDPERKTDPTNSLRYIEKTYEDLMGDVKQLYVTLKGEMPEGYKVKLKNFLTSKEKYGKMDEQGGGNLEIKLYYNEYLYKGKRSMKSSNVKLMQADLKKLGKYNMAIDGSYGNGTVRAVENLQRERGLVVDGKCGKNTQTEIKKALLESESKVDKSQGDKNTKVKEGFTDRKWNLRSSYQTFAGNYILTMPSGASVDILGEFSGREYKGSTLWYKIRYTSSQGVVEGYSHSYAIKTREKKGYTEYWHDRQTKVVKMPKDKVRMDVIMGRYPKETVKSLWNRLDEKPVILCNAGMFGMKNGVTLSYTLDEGQLLTEGVYSRYALCQYSEEAGGELKIEPMKWMETIGKIKDGHSVDIKEALGGQPPLVRNGKVIVDNRGLDNGFINYRHPRLVVGLTKDEIVIIITYGRNPSKGWYGRTIGELQSLCLQLGLIDAVNLDGGGSITVFDSQGKDVDGINANRPVDHMVAFYWVE